MGILDFREICSANPTHTSVKDALIGISNLPDDFELFCQEFFSLVKRFRIFKSISNGPDGGIDLGVEEVTESGTIRWLVSCKHYAHSDKYICDNVERNITERVLSWECDGFIPFYTKPPTSTLSRHIDGAEKVIKVERYYKDKIEQELLNSSIGVSLAARYFPESLKNHYQNFIKESTEYGVADIKIEDGVAKIKNLEMFVGNGNPERLKEHLSELVRQANISTGFELHKPYFNKAIKDAIELQPSMFTLKEGSSYFPTWDVASLFTLACKEGLSKSYFIAAIWSFWDHKKANNSFAEFMVYWSMVDRETENLAEEMAKIRQNETWESHLSNIIERALLIPGFLGIKLQDKERDIVSRCFAYANPI